MKNLVLKFAFLIFAGTLCSFQSPKPSIQDIFQTALDLKVLEEHLAKNNEGELLPLTLISNNYIGTDIPLNFAGKKVVIKSNLPEAVAVNQTILELTEIKMKGKKSHLTFKYAEKTIKVRLRKEENTWTAKTVTVKWKNGFDTQFVSVEEKRF